MSECVLCFTSPSKTSYGSSGTGCLKDLKRFWRMDDDDDERNVARIFAETNVLANDLLPIMQSTLGTGSRGNKIALACGQSRSLLPVLYSLLTRQGQPTSSVP